MANVDLRKPTPISPTPVPMNYLEANLKHIISSIDISVFILAGYIFKE